MTIETTIDILRRQRNMLIEELDKITSVIELLGDVAPKVVSAPPKSVKQADREVAQAMEDSKERTQQAVNGSKFKRRRKKRVVAHRSRAASAQLTHDLLEFIKSSADTPDKAVPIIVIGDHLYKRYAKDTENKPQFTKGVSARMISLFRKHDNLQRVQREGPDGFSRYCYYWK